LVASPRADAQSVDAPAHEVKAHSRLPNTPRSVGPTTSW
jgi:hypothetical protein